MISHFHASPPKPQITHTKENKENIFFLKQFFFFFFFLSLLVLYYSLYATTLRSGFPHASCPYFFSGSSVKSTPLSKSSKCCEGGLSFFPSRSDELCMDSSNMDGAMNSMRRSPSAGWSKSMLDLELVIMSSITGPMVMELRRSIRASMSLYVLPCVVVSQLSERTDLFSSICCREVRLFSSRDRLEELPKRNVADPKLDPSEKLCEKLCAYTAFSLRAFLRLAHQMNILASATAIRMANTTEPTAMNTISFGASDSRMYGFLS